MFPEQIEKRKLKFTLFSREDKTGNETVSDKLITDNIDGTQNPRKLDLTQP